MILIGYAGFTNPAHKNNNVLLTDNFERSSYLKKLSILQWLENWNICMEITVTCPCDWDSDKAKSNVSWTQALAKKLINFLIQHKMEYSNICTSSGSLCQAGK